MGKGGTGKGCPTINNNERALLEGYRMGLQAHSGGTQSSKSNGKSGGKGSGQAKSGGKGSGQAGKVDRTCRRVGCRAAEKQQATFGGAANCFVCGLSLAASLPVEQLCSWAWQQRLEEKKAAPKGADTTGAAADSKNKATPKAAAKPSAKPAQLSDAQLAALRAERLAELKAAAADPAAAPATPLQEVAKVFVETAPVNKTFVVEKDDAENFQGLDSQAQQLLTSLQAELWPSEMPLKGPQEVIDGLLARSSAVQKDQGRAVAENALQTTRATITTMRSGGAQEDDELLLLLVAREVKQAADSKRRDDKAPSKELRLATMNNMRAEFAKTTRAQKDGRIAGSAKAAERAAARVEVAKKMLEAATRMHLLAQQASQELHQTHTQRSEHKDEQGDAVLALFEEKIADIEAEDVVFLDADNEMPEETATETERDEALRLASLIQKQLVQLQQATAAQQPAAGTTAAPAGQAAPAEAAATGTVTPTVAQLWHDLTLDFVAEPSQLPTHDDIGAELKTAATKLHTLLQVVPWGSSLPSVQFMHLDLQPCHLHGLVGDAIWLACWGDRQAGITSQHAVPYKLLNIAKSVAENLTITVTDEQRTWANGRYAAVVKDATARRNAGGPY